MYQHTSTPHLRGGRGHTQLQEVLYTLQESAIGCSLRMLLSHIECGRLPPLPYKPWRKDKDVPTHLHLISLGVRTRMYQHTPRGGVLVHPCPYAKAYKARVGGVHTRCGTKACVGSSLSRSPEVYTIPPAVGCGLAPLSGVGTPTRGYTSSVPALAGQLGSGPGGFRPYKCYQRKGYGQICKSMQETIQLLETSRSYYV
ncbi:hypothetical protein AAC387_Pa07g1116 [Persea americana]